MGETAREGLIIVPLSWQQRGAQEGCQHERDWVGFASEWASGRAWGRKAFLSYRSEGNVMSGCGAGAEQGAWGTSLPPAHSGHPHQPPMFLPQELPQTPAHGRQPEGEGPE